MTGSVKTPTLLAIDSSTETLCLAACANGQTRLWAGIGGAQASAILVGQARALLADLGTDWQHLDAVAFAQGPGAFTGLRTACSTAQGLAFGAGCGVLPIDSLMIVAEAAMSVSRGTAPLDVAVVMDARMGEVYAARYRATEQGWQVIEAPLLTTAGLLSTAWGARRAGLLAGSGVSQLVEAQRGDAQPPGPIDVTAVVEVTDAARTAALLTLAQQAWQGGRMLPPSEAVPMYVRDKVAQTVAERAAQARIDTGSR